jgi:hypothetical protein
MPLIDVTRWFKDPAINWRLRGRAFTSQFDGRVVVDRGVYAHLDMNSSPLPIHDRNGPGKVIVLGSAMALKFGKFLGGLPGRMLQNFDHFHRRRPDGSCEDGIFPAVLTYLVVLDLMHRRHDEIRPIETTWNRSIRAELKNRGLIHPQHRSRAESVNLARAITCAELLQIIQPIADRIAP